MDCLVAGVMLVVNVSGFSLSEAKLRDKCLKTGFKKKLYAAVVGFITENSQTCFCMLLLVDCYSELRKYQLSTD